MQEFTEKARALGPWSYSKARMSFECPYKFGLKYIQKEKEPPQARSSELEIGSALHKALELMVQGMPADDSVEEALSHVVLTADEQDQYYACHDQLTAFETRIDQFKKKHGITRNRLYVERRVAITDDFKPGSYWNNEGETIFRGQWDLGMYSNSGYMVVIDHKRRGKAEIAHYEQQLKSYAVTAMALHPELKGVKSAIHFVESGEILWADTYSAEHINTVIRAEFIDWINKAAEESESGTIAVGHYCRWCPYKDTICLPERKARRAQAKETGVPANLISR